MSSRVVAHDASGVGWAIVDSPAPKSKVLEWTRWNENWRKCLNPSEWAPRECVFSKFPALPPGPQDSLDILNDVSIAVDPPHGGIPSLPSEIDRKLRDDFPELGPEVPRSDWSSTSNGTKAVSGFLSGCATGRGDVLAGWSTAEPFAMIFSRSRALALWPRVRCARVPDPAL